jgi:ribosomal protein S18 acetylase RimI-like enzyme
MEGTFLYTDQYDRAITLNGKHLSVRGLRNDDRDLLARFFAALGDESRAHFRPHAFTPAGAADVVREAADPRGIYFLALADGDEPAGYGFLRSLDRPFPTLGIAIADAWQNQGLGKLLMGFLVGVAERLGRQGVDLTVDEDNPRAIHVYEATGFRLVRTIREMRLVFSGPDQGLEAPSWLSRRGGPP